MPRCACEFCSAALDLPDHMAGKPFPCPNCGKTFTVPRPGAAKSQSYMDQLLASENERVSSVPLPPPAARPSAEGNPLLRGAVEVPAKDTSGSKRIESPPRREPEPPPAPRRSLSSRDRFRDEEEDDFEDDLFAPPRTRGAATPDVIRGAQMGLVFSLLGLAGILIGLFVFLFYQSRRGPVQMESIFFILSFAALLTFVLTLMGIIFSGRGLHSSNDYNRGSAVAGLVCGILGVVLSVILGSFVLFCGVFLHALRF
jgi:hypothetical protein